MKKNKVSEGKRIIKELITSYENGYITSIELISSIRSLNFGEFGNEYIDMKINESININTDSLKMYLTM